MLATLLNIDEHFRKRRAQQRVRRTELQVRLVVLVLGFRSAEREDSLVLAKLAEAEDFLRKRDAHREKLPHARPASGALFLPRAGWDGRSLR